MIHKSLNTMQCIILHIYTLVCASIASVCYTTMDFVIYLVLLVVTLLAFLYFRPSKHGKPIPGPDGWPIVGYAFKMKGKQPHVLYSELAQTYGDIFKMKLFGINFIVLNSSELIRKAFTMDPYKKSMNDRAISFYGEYFLYKSQSIGSMLDGHGPIHRDLRKGYNKGLHVYGEGRSYFEERIASEFVTLVHRIERFNGQEFDMFELIKRSLTNVISILLGGHDLKDDDKDVNIFWQFDEQNDYFLKPMVNAVLFTFPFLRFVPGLYKEPYEAFDNAKEAILKRYIYDRKDSFDPDDIKGLVDFMLTENLQATKAGREPVFTEDKLKAMTLETVSAGILTSLSSLTTIFLCLVNHPECQVRLQKEIDEVVGRNRQPALADRSACVYAEAVALEAQRYATTIPTGVPHFCRKQIQFEGYEVPANTVIVPNVWRIHHDAEVWGDPYVFRPERWIDSSGQLLSYDHEYRKNWLPFGIGRRQCIGESMARSRIFLYISTMLQEFTFTMVPGHEVDCDPRAGHYNVDFTCRPKPYLCRAIPRK